MDACAARKAGTQAELPRKTPKKPKPTRFGVAYVARRADGAWLLERRPDSEMEFRAVGDPRHRPVRHPGGREVGDPDRRRGRPREHVDDLRDVALAGSLRLEPERVRGLAEVLEQLVVDRARQRARAPAAHSPRIHDGRNGAASGCASTPSSAASIASRLAA